MNTYRYLIAACVSVLAVGFGTYAIYKYGGTKFEAINSYYADLLHKRELRDVSGPHYWKDGRVFWVQDGYLKSSSDFGATGRNEIRLPHTFPRDAVRHVSEYILADESAVYLRKGDQFQKILDDFRCWRVCGSRLHSGDFVIGEYGDRIYHIDATTAATRLLLRKPPETTHFHVTAVDPFTNDIYTSLGDAHKARVTGIMRSQDRGETWQWLHKMSGGPRETHHQPTAVFFDEDAIYFGEDNRPHGISVLHRKTGAFQRVFLMPKIFKSYFTGLAKANGSFWGLSRSVKHPNPGPLSSFGLLWWSGDGKDWVPIQIFQDTPYWLQHDEERALISVGFLEQSSNVFVFDVPDAAQMTEWVNAGPRVTLLDRLFADLQDRP